MTQLALIPDVTEEIEGGVSWFVPGRPRPQGSKRAFVNKKTGQPIIVDANQQTLVDWRGDVKREAIEAWGDRPPLEGPVAVVLNFQMPRPKSHPKRRRTWPVTRPDVDKLSRSVLDALTHVCFGDDAQVTVLLARKVWAAPIGVEITVGSDVG